MALTESSPRIAYEVHGDHGPWVVLSSSLGCTRRMWDSLVEILAPDYRVLCYDLPGHGESDTGAASGLLSVLARDVLRLLDTLGVERAHYVGISIGGMIGQILAIMAPQRLSSLVLANTSSRMPESARQAWQARIEVVQREGSVEPVVAPSLERWFTESFRAAHPERLEELRADFMKTSAAGYIACAHAIMNLDTLSALGTIECPTLIIGGTEDLGSPRDALDALHSGIAGSRLLLIDGAGHLSSVDHPDVFGPAVHDFLDRQSTRV